MKSASFSVLVGVKRVEYKNDLFGRVEKKKRKWNSAKYYER